MNISPPVIVMITLFGVFIVSFLLFWFFFRKSEKKEQDQSLFSNQPMEIEVKELSPEDFELEGDAGLQAGKIGSEAVKTEYIETMNETESQEVFTASAPSKIGVTPDEIIAAKVNEKTVDVDLTPEEKEEIKFEAAAKIRDEDLPGISSLKTGEKELPDDAGKEAIKIEFADIKSGPKSSLEDSIFDFDEIGEQLEALDAKPLSSNDIFQSEQADADGSLPFDIFEGEKPAPAAVEEKREEPEAPSEEDIEQIVKKMSRIHTEEKIPEIYEEAPEEPAPLPARMDPEEEKRHEKAKRIARVIINDIRNYNPEKLAEGIRIGNIIKTLGVEIERGRQLYIKRVPQDIARSTNYYREALIKLLADGRKDLLGL